MAESEGELVDIVRATLAGMGWTIDPPESRGQTRDRWESWQALVGQAEEYAAAQPETADLNGFVDDLDRRAAEQHAPVAQGVTLATFHAAKGLEWDSVFLVGLQDGTLPITYAETPEAIEEERRLLYVGMTRAREDLAAVLGPGAQPRPGGAAQAVALPRAPAPRASPDPVPKASSRRARMCSVCGKPLASTAEKTRGRCEGCPAPYDEQLFDRLREWRRVRAKTDEVAAFMVFSNRTLEEVAEHRPQTPRPCWRSMGSVRRSSRSTARSCSRSSAEAVQTGLPRNFGNTHKMVCSLHQRRGNFLRHALIAHHGPDKAGARSTEGGGTSGQQNQMIPMTQQWINEQFRHAHLWPRLRFDDPAFRRLRHVRPCGDGLERQIAAIEVVTKGHLGHATKRDLAYVPGTNAWSPPLC